WSRFMRTALSGQAPAALPGLGEPSWFAAPFSAPAAAPPAPPAPVAEQPSGRSDSGGGLGFLLLGELVRRRGGRKRSCRRSRESEDPDLQTAASFWIPTYAGMSG